MLPYESLSDDERLERLRALARKALAAYRLQDGQLACLCSGNRTLLKVEDASGCRYALRLWPVDEAGDRLDRELRWLTALRRDLALHVPEPILSISGEWIGRVAMAGVPGFRNVVLLGWVSGRFFDSQLSVSQLQDVGAFLARLHHHGAAFAAAQRWTGPPTGSILDAFPGVSGWIESLRSGSAWTTFPDSLRDLGEQAAPRILAAVERILDPAERGLIHGAAHQAHYLFHEERVGMIDFSACRIGHALEDLAHVCRHMGAREGYTELRDALLQGYSSMGRDRSFTASDVEAAAVAQLLTAPETPSASRGREYRAGLMHHLERLRAGI